MSLIPSGFAKSAAGGFYDHPIEQSLRFNDDDSAYLSRTPASSGNTTTWTLSLWFKFANVNLGSFQASHLFTINTGSDDSNYHAISLFSTGSGGQLKWSKWTTEWVGTSRYFRDPSAWYHLVCVWDTTNGTAADRARLYINGERIANNNNPNASEASIINTSKLHALGARAGYGSYFDGEMAEVHFIDGQALDADSFGETKSGVWKPIAYTGSYGTNGFYLDFDGTYYNDKSGNGNNWTANNLAATDVVLDSPTNNFCTLNPLVARFGASGGNTLDRDFYEGNLKVRTGGSSAYNQIGTSSFAFTSGKWYAEFYQNVIGNPNIVGFGNPENGDWQSNSWSCTRWSNQTGDVIYNVGTTDTNSTMSGSYTAGDIIGVALDMDTKHCEYFKNGTSMGSFDFDLGIHDGKAVAFICGNSNTTTDAYITANFGQDSSFAGVTTAGGYTDDNGYGDFKYSVPSGYLALCTANLEVPDAMNPALDNSPQDYFNTVLWTGDGASSRSITGVGFQPDFVWTKFRNAANSHYLFDSVRGTAYTLFTDGTYAENTNYNRITSFDSDGYSLGSDANVNGSGYNIVAWNWKAGGTGVSNTDGSITSTVSANTDAGFSIVSYTGNGGTNVSVGHGLNEAPQIVIIKDRSTSNNWYVNHTLVDGTNDGMYLNLIDANGTFSGSVPTSSVFYVDGGRNASGNNQIAYCFHSVEGFSKFGKYSANSDTNGPFIYTGFKPAMVIVKRATDTQNWIIYDNKRDVDNEVRARLFPDLSSAESDYSGMDFLSNGFKIRINSSQLNYNADYIYMAFAENPFKYSTAR